MDLLDQIYMYFLKQFASAEGRNGGQFWSPECVAKLLVEMLAPYSGRVYDPCTTQAVCLSSPLSSSKPTARATETAASPRVTSAYSVRNLLVNASKFTGEGGQIWLEAAREQDQAVIHVRDTGLGIAPELLPGIFDLFVQADDPRHRSQSGLGIGLTLIKRLVEMHGGTVDALSAGESQGQRVYYPAAGTAEGGDRNANAANCRARSCRETLPTHAALLWAENMPAVKPTQPAEATIKTNHS